MNPHLFCYDNSPSTKSLVSDAVTVLWMIRVILTKKKHWEFTTFQAKLDLCHAKLELFVQQRGGCTVFGTCRYICSSLISNLTNQIVSHILLYSDWSNKFLYSFIHLLVTLLVYSLSWYTRSHVSGIGSDLNQIMVILAIYLFLIGQIWRVYTDKRAAIHSNSFTLRLTFHTKLVSYGLHSTYHCTV